MDIKPSKPSLSSETIANPAAPLIQVIQDEELDTNRIDQVSSEKDEEAEKEIDWSFPQTLQEENITMGISSKYGFNNLYQGHGENIAQILAHDLLDIQDIDSSTPSSRRNQRLLAEEVKFDPDYFMWDTIMNPEITRLINDYKSPEKKALKRIQSNKDETDKTPDPFLVFNEKEQEQMRNLPNKNCNILIV